MFRLDQEKDQCKFYYWLTLQYDDVHVPRLKDWDDPLAKCGDPEEMCFSKAHCRQFFEVLRKRYGRKNGSTFKHFLVCEYGPNGTHRPHYHLLLMVYNDLGLDENYKLRKEMREFILHDAWPNGHVTEKTFHGRVLSYLTKYCTKPELLGEKHTMKPFTLISRGIGKCLLDKIPQKQLDQMREELDFTYWYNGSKMQLPRYIVDKILPHSLADLRKLIPTENVDDPASWSDYRTLAEIRARLKEKQDAMQIAYYQQRGDETAKERFDRISYEMDKFKSKCQMRKDL